MRGRGLKLVEKNANLGECGSLPMRGRGLKQKLNEKRKELLKVAPYAGAWIETAVRLG